MLARSLLRAVTIPARWFAAGPVGGFGWSDFSSQQYTAAHYNGVTYYGYLKSDGNLHIASWDNAAKVVIDDTDMGSLGADLHNVPSVIVRESDKRVMIFYGTHNGTDLYFRVSTNPEDVSSMGSQQTLASQIGGGHFTYPMVHQLRGEANDPLYLFFRNESKGAFSAAESIWSYSTSDDDGVTWAPMTALWVQPGLGSYLMTGKASETRIDIIATDGSHGVDTNMGIGHAYYEAGDWHETDGAVLGSGPYELADVALVYDGTGNEGAQVNSVAMGLDSEPVAAFRVWDSYSSPEDLRYWWARWDGSAWQAQEIAVNGNDTIWGNITLDPADPSRAWVGKLASGQTEMFLYSSPDNGATFGARQLTFGSVNTQSTPVPVREAGSGLVVLWGDDAANWGSGDATPIGWG